MRLIFQCGSSVIARMTKQTYPTARLIVAMEQNVLKNPFVPETTFARSFYLSPILGRDIFILGKTKGATTEKLRGRIIDESDDSTVNIDALADAESDQSEAQEDQEAHKKFQLFPDMDTLDVKYNGIKFRDLPYVTIVCTKNNTRLWAHDDQGNNLDYCTPKMFGFLNAQKRTNVAAQVAGMNMGQRLRNKSITTIKVRVGGFNNGRIASIKGLVQAGINVVCVHDVTPVQWTWCKRAKKKRRRN